MFDFIEYMWYLLTTPFKQVRKSINSWYILCKVFGKRFDELKADILRARDEGMIATCSQNMLSTHGADRGLTRYAGELPENFRSRIAMYEEVCALGGTNEGIVLAVKTLGFNNVSIITAKALKCDEERWAEFYVMIWLNMEDTLPIHYDILRKQVRVWKQVGAKDNYLLTFIGSGISSFLPQNVERVVARAANNGKMITENRVTFRLECTNELKSHATINIKNDLWLLDGMVLLDGSRKLDAYELTEEI